MSRTPAITVAALLLLASATALGRAGGGQSYSGSRSSYSGSRSSYSSSSSRSSYSSPRSSYSSYSSSPSSTSSYSSYSSGGGSYSTSGSGCGAGLGTLFFFLLFAVIVVWLNASSGSKADSSSMAAVRRFDDERRRRPAVSLAALKQRDPTFDQELFLKNMESSFVELQNAWSSQNFEQARRFMSDGVLRRFTTQLELNRFFGKRNAVADVKVRGRRIVGVEAEDSFDILHVEFDASLRDCDVAANLSDAEAQGKASRASVTEFTEIWSFVRRPDAGGKAKGSLAEGKCPACGAPALQSVNATCEYCKAILNSGAFDWVLSEITQEEEFQLVPRSAVAGFTELVAGDPALNRQVLEDRAALVFWKYIAALATGEAKPFQRYAAASVFDTFAAKLSPGGKAYAQTAVGSVDLTAIDTTDAGELSHFKVKWSTTGAGTGIVHTSVISLFRTAGAKTNADTGMSTERCHKCAAPQTDRNATSCEFCSAVLSEDWSFQSLTPVDQFIANRKAARRADGKGAVADRVGILQDPWERQRVLTAMVAMARADGVVTEKERKLLNTCARRWSIPMENLQALLKTPINDLKDLVPATPDAAKILFRGLAAAAWADGRIDASEGKLLQRMAEHLNLTPEETRAALAEGKEIAASNGPAQA